MYYGAYNLCVGKMHGNRSKRLWVGKNEVKFLDHTQSGVFSTEGTLY